MPGQKSRRRGLLYTQTADPGERGLLYTQTADPGGGGFCTHRQRTQDRPSPAAPSLSCSADSAVLGPVSPLRQSACRSLDASLFRQSACRSQVWRYSVVQVLRVFSCLGAEGIQLSRCAGSASRSAAVCLGKLRGASPYQAVITLLGA